MINPPPGLSRRRLITGFGCSLLAPLGVSHALAQTNRPMEITAAPGPIRLTSSDSPQTAWRLNSTTAPVTIPGGSAAYQITLANQLPVPLALRWRGLSAPGLTPLLNALSVAAGSSRIFDVPATQSGTFLLDGRLLGDTAAEPMPACAVVISEPGAPAADRDEILLIEDWRIGLNSTLIGVGRDPAGTRPDYTVNGKANARIAIRPHERLRLRVINAAQRTAIALHFENLEVWIMAIDSQPCEPFLAREGRLVLPCGSRFDVIIDSVGAVSSVHGLSLMDGRAPMSIGSIHIDGAPFRPDRLPAPKMLAEHCRPGATGSSQCSSPHLDTRRRRQDGKFSPGA